jgi:TolB protein
MDLTPEPNSSDKRSTRSRRRRAQWSVRLTPLGVVVVVGCNLALLAALAWPLIQSRLGMGLPALPGFNLPIEVLSSFTPTLQATASVSPTPVPPTPTLLSPTATLTPEPTQRLGLQQGVILLALDEGNHSHLFAYQPFEGSAIQPIALTRLTYGAWDDHSPAVSPDGRWVVFVSNRNGYWDLYLLDLSTGIVDRLTDTLDYEGAPSWSPDGLWVAYEAYVENNLDIYILSRNDSQISPIRLTANSSVDHSPVWSPLGRQIAFVSNRSGEPEIWLADLDQADEAQFRNVSRSPGQPDAHPAWSPDGNLLAWTSGQDGYHNLVTWNSTQSDQPTHYLGSGDWPVWSPDGRLVLTALLAPNQNYLSAYPIDGQGLIIPPVALPGTITGLDWADTVALLPLHDPLRLAAASTPTPLWLPVLNPGEDVPGGRRQLVEIEDVQVPYPYLQDLVDESFLALRDRVAAEIGWDLLSSLENAYVPLTAPLDPGMGKDWLYTGRAFAINTAPVNAGWMVVVREEFGAQTYWRVYLRARFQDGSVGMPLKAVPWDFYARFQGDPVAFEQGGSPAEGIPSGYWLDFTSLARAYGWERLPALTSWRASYPAARFNEFVLVDGLDWQAAMLEIYPAEVLITPTRIIPPSRTPTLTPRFYQSPTPTETPTPRPTLTPVPPASSPTPSRTPTRTPAVPTRTPTRTPSGL